MYNCLELIAEIVAVIPVPVGTFRFAVPPQVTQQRIMADAITSPSSAVVADGATTRQALLDAIRQQPGFVVETYIYNTTGDEPLPEGTSVIELGTNVSETSKNATAGYSYTAKVSMRSYDPIDRLRALVDRLQDCPAFDLFIIDDAENVYCCRGMEPATRISMQASLPVNTANQIDIEVTSPCGILPIFFG